MHVPIWVSVLVALTIVVLLLRIRKVKAERDGAQLAYREQVGFTETQRQIFQGFGPPRELTSVVFGEERQAQWLTAEHLVPFRELRQLKRLQGADAVAYREHLWEQGKRELARQIAEGILAHATVYAENHVDGLRFRVSLYALPTGTTAEEERALAEGWLEREPKLPTAVGVA